MLDINDLTRYPKKSNTSDRYKKFETNFLQDADKLFDIFAMLINTESNVKFSMASEWHLMIMLFLKI